MGNDELAEDLFVRWRSTVCTPGPVRMDPGMFMILFVFLSL